MDVCRTTVPQTTTISGGLQVACHLHRGSTPDPSPAARYPASEPDLTAPDPAPTKAPRTAHDPTGNHFGRTT